MSLIFQVIDWRTYQTYGKSSKTIIQIFGKTEKGESVMVEVDDYYSSFYTLASEEKIKKCNDNYNIKIFPNKPFKRFYGFHGDQKELFNKVKSDNVIGLKKISNKLLSQGEEVFESNKDIIIQFIHDHKIKSCGWISINEDNLRNN